VVPQFFSGCEAFARLDVGNEGAMRESMRRSRGFERPQTEEPDGRRIVVSSPGWSIPVFDDADGSDAPGAAPEQ
jgi:hypothetical protein